MIDASVVGELLVNQIFTLWGVCATIFIISVFIMVKCNIMSFESCTVMLLILLAVAIAGLPAIISRQDKYFAKIHENTEVVVEETWRQNIAGFNESKEVAGQISGSLFSIKGKIGENQVFSFAIENENKAVSYIEFTEDIRDITFYPLKEGEKPHITVERRRLKWIGRPNEKLEAALSSEGVEHLKSIHVPQRYIEENITQLSAK